MHLHTSTCRGRVDVVVQCANKNMGYSSINSIINAAGGIVTTWENKDPVLAGNIVVSNNISNHKEF